MIGIYKITNKVNGKSYIGQSVNIEKRLVNHKATASKIKDHCYDYPLYRAFRKYGFENFEFEILEECSNEQLDEKERFWISYFNTLKDGYNQTFGGDGSFNRLDYKKLEQIDLLLEKSNLKMSDIAKIIDISEEMIQGINTGRYWNRIDIDYPIRKHNIKSNRIVADKSSKFICKKCGGIKKSNTGDLCVDCYREEHKSKRPSYVELKHKLLDENNNYISLGKYYGVTDNAIRKWCLYYGLPTKKKELKQFRLENKYSDVA